MGTVLGPLDPNDPAIALLQQLPRPAPWWQLILPMLLGDSFVIFQDGLEIRQWRWRGKTYLERVSYVGHFAIKPTTLGQLEIRFPITIMLPDTGVVVTAYYSDPQGVEQSRLAFYTPANTTEAEGEWEGYYINEGWYETNAEGDILGPISNVHSWSGVQETG